MLGSLWSGKLVLFHFCRGRGSETVCTSLEQTSILIYSLAQGHVISSPFCLNIHPKRPRPAGNATNVVFLHWWRESGSHYCWNGEYQQNCYLTETQSRHQAGRRKEMVPTRDRPEPSCSSRGCNLSTNLPAWCLLGEKKHTRILELMQGLLLPAKGEA